MPIYEYRCESCGHELEKLQRLNDPLLKDCPECGKPKLRRLISAVGFRLKGAGWYETDFKQGNKRNLAESSDSKSVSTASESSSAKGGTAAKTESSGGKSPAVKEKSSGSGSDSDSSASNKKSSGSSAAGAG